MGKKSDLSITTVASVGALLTAGRSSMREIAAQCKISIGSVSNIKRRMSNSQRPGRLGKCGAKKQTTSYDDRAILRILKQEPLLSVPQLKEKFARDAGICISQSTIKRRLRKFGCKSVRPKKCPKLTDQMRKKRLEFAKKHQAWTVQQWRKVCFSDESLFECNSASRKRVWHIPGTPYPIFPTVKHPPKVMVWGMISHKGAGRLHVVEGMMNGAQYHHVLQTRMIPQLHQWFDSIDDCIFMHDSAPCHKARINTEFLQSKNVTVLDWPGNSPDLNP